MTYQKNAWVEKPLLTRDKSKQYLLKKRMLKKYQEREKIFSDIFLFFFIRISKNIQKTGLLKKKHISEIV